MIVSMGQLARATCAGILGLMASIAVALVISTPAVAKTCTKRVAPPGHAGSTQYFETVPTSCGSSAPPSTGGSGGSINHLGHGRAGVQRLSHLGSTGNAAASLAAATAPPISSASGAGSTGRSRSSGTSSGSGSRSSRSLTGAGLPSATGGSSAGALRSALSGSGTGGLGIALPILMALGVIAAVAAGVVRTRRSRRPSV
jgi:hypothetical protein